MQRSQNFIHVEEFDNQGDRQFISSLVKPYFKDIFKDLSMRSSTFSVQKEFTFLDKETFIEYTNLPGIIAQRFAQQFDCNEDGQISKKDFIRTLIKVYLSNACVRMRMTFNMYDFNNDGLITKEDVRLLLSHIPVRCQSEISEEPSIQPMETSTKSSFYKSRMKQSKQIDSCLNLNNLNCQIKCLNSLERVRSQDEINKFLEDAFYFKETMTFEEYLEFNNQVSSDMFYSIMMILHERLPCSQNFFRLKRVFRKNHKLNINISCHSQSPSRLIASPTLLRDLSCKKNNNISSTFKKPMTPTLNNIRKKLGSKTGNRRGTIFTYDSSDVNSQLADEEVSFVSQSNESFKVSNLNMTSQFGNQDNSGVETTKNIIVPRTRISVNLTKIQTKLIRNNSSNSNSPGMQNVMKVSMSPKKTLILKKNISSLKLPNINSNTGSIMTSSTPTPKSKFSLKSRQNSVLQQSTISIVAQNDIDTSFFQYALEEKEQASEAPEDIIDNFGAENNTKYVHFEGDCFLKSYKGTFRRCWLAIMGNELFIYKEKDDPQHKIMHCLVGTFIKELECEEDEPSKLTLWPLQLTLGLKKCRYFYFTSQQEQTKWSLAIKESIGYSNILDFYKIGSRIWQGHFGQIKIATHKKTKQQFTIKCIKKACLNSIEILQQKREIEVLKMSNHKNICKMIELFENSDSFYIVLEQLEGDDLFNYLLDRNFQISEKRVAEIITQLIKALKYLHSYGIVHRDITLEHIMMSDNSESAIPKIVDFRLSKIIGPSEQAKEQFGTVGYIAPEVIKQEPYGFSCDVWSIGCLCHAMLSGMLPFDNEDRAKVIDGILNQPLKFDSICWKGISEEAKDFVQGLLMKDPLKRLTLEQALDHIWLL